MLTMVGRRTALKIILVLLALSPAAACESPYAAFDSAAADYGFQRSQVTGEGFDHRVYRKSGDSGPLHVYLASDGKPWLRRQLPAGDPTSRDPMVLDLMALDPADSVMLGRPCYHGLQDEARCSSELWTSRRYAEEVVASLATALRKVSGSRQPIVLIGHSGGGVLAMLLSRRLPEVIAVITIAAPLDHAAWTDFHGYLPLDGSLNPAEVDPPPADVGQLHMVGTRDSVMPPALLSAALARIAAPPPLVVSGPGHNDGWMPFWPGVLARIDIERFRSGD